MKITVRLFAVLRERVGRGTVPLTLDAGATVADAWTVLAAQHTETAPLAESLRSAVNGIYADSTTVLYDGDEIAFLPPMSGG